MAISELKNGYKTKVTKTRHTHFLNIMKKYLPFMTQEINDSEFKSYVEKDGLYVIDCWAPWCGPCRMLSPIIDELSKDFEGKINFAKLNVDNNPTTSQTYGIMSIPTLLVFKNGELVDRLVGALPKDQLASKLNTYL